MKEKDYYLK